MRDEFLNETLFRNLAHTRELMAAWVADSNTERPHSALGCQTPAGFALRLTTAIARPAARDESSARRAIAQPAPIGVKNHRAPGVAGSKTNGRSDGTEPQKVRPGRAGEKLRLDRIDSDDEKERAMFHPRSAFNHRPVANMTHQMSAPRYNVGNNVNNDIA